MRKNRIEIIMCLFWLPQNILGFHTTSLYAGVLVFLIIKGKALPVYNKIVTRMYQSFVYYFLSMWRYLHYEYQLWWRHQIETFSALLAFCAGNSPVIGEFPAQRPVTRSLDVFFDQRLNQQLCKQWRRWWFETLPCSLWRHCNDRSTLTSHLPALVLITSLTV